MTRPLAFLARLLVASLLTAAVFATWGEALARASLPLLRAAYSMFDGRSQVIELTLANRGAVSGHDSVIRLVVAPGRPVLVGDRFVTADPQGRATITVLTAYLWQPWLLALPLAIAWPPRSARPCRESCRRTGWLLLMLSAVAVVDVPATLYAEVWELYAQAHAPSLFSPLLAWQQFLQHGGRFALGLAVGLVSVALAARDAPAHGRP